MLLKVDLGVLLEEILEMMYFGPNNVLVKKMKPRKVHDSFWIL